MKKYEVTVDAIKCENSREEYMSFTKTIEAFTPCMAKNTLLSKLSADGFIEIELEAEETELHISETEEDMNNKVMQNITYGLFVLTTSYNGKDNGCIINTAIQITTDPGRISIAVNNDNYTRDLIDDSCRFNVSLISEDADFELFKHFGFASGRDTDKFADFPDYMKAANGVPYITKGTNGYISCEVEQKIVLETHTIFIARITDAEKISEVPSVSYAYYHKNIKPAPSAKVEKGKTVWRCKVCGYEYEGETLPEGFVCPLCKHPASDFEKITG